MSNIYVIINIIWVKFAILLKIIYLGLMKLF
jgi:hypothetical protein